MNKQQLCLHYRIAIRTRREALRIAVRDARPIFGLLLATLALLAVVTQAAHLRDVPRTLTQPDGRQLQCLVTGDEFHRRLHDAAGYTIVKDPATGFYVYADRQGDRQIETALVPTSHVAGIADPAVAGLEPGLDYVPVPAHREQAERRRLVRDESCRTPTTGIVNNLVIFIRFADQPPIPEPFSFFDDEMNATTGSSQWTFYQEVSSMQLDVQTSFYPPPAGETVLSYQDPQFRGYYQPYDEVTNPIGYEGEEERAQREHDLLRDAVAAVEADIPIWLDIDADADGQVDNVVFLCAGPAGEEILWPHWWTLHTHFVTIHGFHLWEYNINLTEFYEAGVLCHEFGHTLGLPDMYIYEDNPNGISPMSVWDLMASTEDPPQHMNAYQKWKYLGWGYDLPLITEDGEYTLNPLSTEAGSAAVLDDCTLRFEGTEPSYIRSYSGSSRAGRLEVAKTGDAEVVLSNLSTEDFLAMGGVQIDGGAVLQSYSIHDFIVYDEFDPDGLFQFELGACEMIGDMGQVMASAFSYFYDLRLANTTDVYFTSGLTINNDLKLEYGSELSLGGSGISIGGDLLVDGEIQLHSTDSELDVDGSAFWKDDASVLLEPGSDIRVAGDWTFESGSQVQLTGCTVTLDGSGEADLISHSPQAGFHDLVVDKSMGTVNVPLASDTLWIAGDLTMQADASLFAYSMNGIKLGGHLYNLLLANTWFDYSPLVLNGSGDQGILAGGWLQLYHLVFRGAGTTTLLGPLDVDGDLRIMSGVFTPGSDEVRLGGDWSNEAGPAAFDETDSRVILDGWDGDQVIFAGETFNELVLDKWEGNLVLGPGADVTCSSYDWTSGTIRVLGGSFTALDLADNNIKGAYVLNSGSVDLYQDATYFVDLDADLDISGGTFTVHGGYPIASYWPYTRNVLLQMSDGVLDFADNGIFLCGDCGYTLTEVITGGTIRTSGSFTSDRHDFTALGGVVELYGPDDAELDHGISSYFHSVNIDKGAARAEGSGTNPGEDDVIRSGARDLPENVLRNLETRPGTGPRNGDRDSRSNTVDAAGSLEINGDLTVSEGLFRQNGYYIQVLGDMTIWGTLVQEDPADILYIGGDLTWYTGSDAVCTTGLIQLEGDLDFINSNAQLDPNHLTEMTGGSDAVIHFEGGNPELGTLSLMKYGAGVEIDAGPGADPVEVAGDVWIDMDNTLNVPGELVVAGTVDLMDMACIEISDAGLLETEIISINGEVQVDTGELRFHDDLNLYEWGVLTISTGSVIGDAEYTGDMQAINGEFNMSGGLFELLNDGLIIGSSATTSIDGGVIRLGWGFQVQGEAVFRPSGGEVKFTGNTYGDISMGAANWFHDLRVDKPYLRQATLLTNALVKHDLLVENNKLDLNGLDLTVEGDVSIAVGGKLDADGSSIYVGGNWANYRGSAGFTEGNGTVIFNGSAPAGLLTDESFNRLEVLKTAPGGGDLVVSQGVTIEVGDQLQIGEGTLVLQDDILDVEGDLDLWNGAGLNCSGYSGSEIRVAANWYDQNTAHDSQVGFNPGHSTVRFDGPSYQTLIGSAAEVDFYNLVLEQDAAAQFYCGSNLRMINDLSVLSGDWTDDYYVYTYRVQGDMQVSESAVWSDATSTLIFDGAGEQSLTGSGACDFGDVIVNKPGGGLLGGVDDESQTAPGDMDRDGERGESVVLQDDLEYITGDLQITAGELGLNGWSLSMQNGTGIYVDGPGTLTMGPDGVLRLGDGVSILVEGLLSAVGNSGAEARITHLDPESEYSLSVDSGGTLSAEYAVFEYMNSAGVNVSFAGLVDPAHAFNHCTFREGGAEGVLLQVGSGQVLNSTGAAFPENTWGSTSNVGKWDDVGEITFSAVSGAFAGEAFEADLHDRIHWLACDPDLVIETVYWWPEEPIAGQQAELQVLLRNQGPGPAGAFNVGYWRDRTDPPLPGDTPDQVQAVAGLGPDQITWVLFPDVDPDETEWTSWVWADYLDEISETDEGNNLASHTVQWVAFPPVEDLSIWYEQSTSQIHLSWSYEGPYDMFNIYRGDTAYFTPQPGNLIHSGMEMFFSEPLPGGSAYYVVTVESAPASPPVANRRIELDTTHHRRNR